MGFFDKLQAKLELYRLEQKYARRKNRTTFSTGAQYVDGEYVYTNPADNPRSPTNMSANSTGSSDNSTPQQSVTWTPPENRQRWS